MRLVSLVCSNTEIVAALGMASHLVGVDDHSDYPEEPLSALPRLGPELDIDVSGVQALRPDLVLASLSVPGHERVVKALEAAGLPLLVLDPTSLSDVLTDIRTVARALEVTAQGENVIREMEAGFNEVRARGGDAVPQRDQPSVLVEWWPKPVIAPGKLSWVQDLLEMAGARNPLGEEEVRSRPMADEEVAPLAPDAFVVSWCGVHPSKYRPEIVANNPAWAHVPAVRNGQIHCIPEAYLGRPGPRLVEGARALRSVVASVR
ncbi:MAG: cobalamin-binding protein [Gemmatimonadota bacterium]|jgi:iron complex transport system substrate-binding protein